MNRTIAAFMRKEFTQVLRDPRMRILLFLAPIIQLALFGLALNSEIRNIRLAVLAAPGDAWVRRIEDRAVASGWFQRVVVGPNEDPMALIRSGRAHAVLVAPPGGLTSTVGRGEGRLQLLVDATNILRARGVESYLRVLLRQTSLAGRPPDASGASLNLQVRVLYNPGLQTSRFMVPAVMAMLICLVTILLTTMSLAREKEVGTFETLVAAPVKIWEILLGKTLPYVILGLLEVPLILGAAMLFFNIPMRGSVLTLLAAAFIFICTTVSIGTLISTFARNQQQAMLGGFIFLFPGILLSGMMFPVENMPPALIGVAYLNPLKYFITLIRNVILKGGDPALVWSHLGVLALIAGVAMLIAARRFRQTLN